MLGCLQKWPKYVAVRLCITTTTTTTTTKIIISNLESRYVVSINLLDSISAVLPERWHSHTVCCQCVSHDCHTDGMCIESLEGSGWNYLLPFPEFHRGTSKTAEDRPCYCHSNRRKKRSQEMDKTLVVTSYMVTYSGCHVTSLRWRLWLIAALLFTDFVQTGTELWHSDTWHSRTSLWNVIVYVCPHSKFDVLGRQNVELGRFRVKLLIGRLGTWTDLGRCRQGPVRCVKLQACCDQCLPNAVLFICRPAVTSSFLMLSCSFAGLLWPVPS